jgi:hypothetical protein
MAKKELTVDLVVRGDNVLSLIIAFLAVRMGQRVALLGAPHSGEEKGKARISSFIGLLQGKEGGFEIALRNRNLLLQMASEIGYAGLKAGLLLPAYHEKELKLLEELALSIGSLDPRLQLLTPEQTVSMSPYLNPVRLEGSLFVPGEIRLDIQSFCERAYQYLSDSTRVSALPMEGELSWQEPLLEGTDFRIRTRKVFLQDRQKGFSVPSGSISPRVQRQVMLPVSGPVFGPSVQIAWVQNPPPAFSVLARYNQFPDRGYHTQPPGIIHLSAGENSRLLLHQDTPPGDPGEERLFAALRKSLRFFPEEEVEWDLFWRSESEGAARIWPTILGKPEPRSFSAQGKRTPNGFFFPFAEDFLAQQGPGIFLS